MSRFEDVALLPLGCRAAFERARVHALVSFIEANDYDRFAA
jgi:hypothetical protein